MLLAVRLKKVVVFLAGNASRDITLPDPDETEKGVLSGENPAGRGSPGGALHWTKDCNVLGSLTQYQWLVGTLHLFNELQEFPLVGYIDVFELLWHFLTLHLSDTESIAHLKQAIERVSYLRSGQAARTG